MELQLLKLNLSIPLCEENQVKLPLAFQILRVQINIKSGFLRQMYCVQFPRIIQFLLVHIMLLLRMFFLYVVEWNYLVVSIVQSDNVI